METPRHIRYADVVRSIGISSHVLANITVHAASDPTREVCGLLFGSAEMIIASLRTANLAEDPSNHFEIDPAALFRAVREERAGGRSLVGYYHSHPRGNAEPSAIDAASAQLDGKLWLILTRDEARAWRAEPGGVEEVALRPS